MINNTDLSLLVYVKYSCYYQDSELTNCCAFMFILFFFSKLLLLSMLYFCSTRDKKINVLRIRFLGWGHLPLLQPQYECSEGVQSWVGAL